MAMGDTTPGWVSSFGIAIPWVDGFPENVVYANAIDPFPKANFLDRIYRMSRMNWARKEH